MRKFVDLHLKANNEDKKLKEMLESAQKLGFSTVAISTICPLKSNAKELATSIGIDLVNRIDIRPKNLIELTQCIRRERRRFEIVAVECKNKAITRQAAKDQRVDILTFPINSNQRWSLFNKREASLAAKNNSAYEFNLSDLLTREKSDRSLMIEKIRKELFHVMREGVPLVASSGASSSLGMRNPRSIASVLTLFDLSENLGLSTISDNPMEIIKKNRKNPLKAIQTYDRMI